jgi:Co/Zn/Cd efflux system component
MINNNNNMKSITTTPASRIAIYTTNHALLRIACFSFGIFVIAVIIGALESGALSLLGDGAAMGVDVITYLANMYAEYKAQNGISNQAKWIFRVIIPSFALCSLLAVTGWITSDAVAILVSPSVDSEDLDVSFLWGFATANIFVDVLCTAAFYIRGRSVFYLEIKGA